MASFVLRNAFISIDGNDFSNHCRECSVNLSADDVDVTAMGAGGHGHLAGIRDDRFTYNPVSGAVGDAAMTPLEFVLSGTITSLGTGSVG